MENNEINTKENERNWYLVATYSGMEYAVKRNLEQRIKSMNMEKYIFRVLIPERKYTEKTKRGLVKEVTERVYPGYVFVDMIVTDESWFIVRNTQMVSGILGSSGGSAKPVPLTPDEINPILKLCGVPIELHVNFGVGDTVRILVGTFAGLAAVVDSIDIEKEKVSVLVDVAARQTIQELVLNQVEKID